MAYFTKRYHLPGTAPGTLVQHQQHMDFPLRIRLMDFNQSEASVNEYASIEECVSLMQRDSVTWVHVEGHPTESALHELGNAFTLHALALEDVLNTGQRPKVEAFDDQLFVVLSMPFMVSGRVETEQVSLFLSDTFLISFCQGSFAPFEPIVERLRDRGSRLRSKGADYLLYSLLDLVIDQGFPVLDEFGQQLEDLEISVLDAVDRQPLEQIHTVKRELILLRRMLWPQREVINHLLRGDHRAIRESTLVYLRDCYDHTIQIMDFLETYRDMTSSMLDVYLTSVSNRMNEVMRVLTVIATIFIPLTFIVGVYGMNFDRSVGPLSMPELSWPYGYVLVWGVMIFVALQMVLYFRRRKWL